MAASPGGHLQELLNIVAGIQCEFFLVTFFSKVVEPKSPIYSRVYYVADASNSALNFAYNTFRSFLIFMYERPSAIISTGAGVAVPIALISKLFRKKLIFIEIASQVHVPTKTGKLLYRLSDRFYIQHEPLLKVFPKAILIDRFKND